jgi:hypothetical protein
MENKLLKTALWYQHRGYAVIPIQRNKKPFIKWEKYQTEMPTTDEINQWWKKWPGANIGLVTGGVSGIDVVDCDSEQGRDALNEFLPDSITMPISKTPKGWHYFFRHRPGLSNGVRVITDCDLRTAGGYIIVPPSRGKNGKAYTWEKDLSIADVKPAPIPEMLFDVLNSGGYANADSSPHIKKDAILIEGQHSVNISGVNTESTKVNKVNISFDKGGRDETLFHLANYLVKGGMDGESISKYLEFVASKCNPPFSKKEINAKIKSALGREKNRSGNLTAEIREIIESTSGNFSSTFVYQTSTKSTFPEDRRKISVILGRFVKDGILERVGNQNGVFRRIETDCTPEDWQNACTDTRRIFRQIGLDLSSNVHTSITPTFDFRRNGRKFYSGYERVERQIYDADTSGNFHRKDGSPWRSGRYSACRFKPVCGRAAERNAHRSVTACIFHDG